MRNSVTQWVSPEVCAHRFVENRWSAGSVSVVCELCGLHGPPVKAGRWRWFAESRAARKFFKLANQIDKALVGVLVVFLFGCSAIVNEDTDADTDTDTDTADTGDTEFDQLDTETIELDTEFDQLDTETGCPWECEPRKGGIEAPFACSMPWGGGEPSAVVNRLFDCPGFEHCCQPWPAPGDGISEQCAGQWECVEQCAGSVLTPNMVCFQSNHLCCEKEHYGKSF